MKTIQKALIALWTEEEGLTMVEYAVAGGMIAAAGVASFQALGLDVKGVIDYIKGQLDLVPGA